MIYKSHRAKYCVIQCRILGCVSLPNSVNPIILSMDILEAGKRYILRRGIKICISHEHLTNYLIVSNKNVRENLSFIKGNHDKYLYESFVEK